MRRLLRATAPAGVVGAALACLGAAGCDAVLGIEAWDVDPGVGGAAASSSGVGSPHGGGGTPSSVATGGGGGGDGAGHGGSGAATTGVSAGGGGGGGAGGCELGTTEHCGACGRSCWGGECVDGACGAALIAPGHQAPSERLAVRGDHLVWVDGTGVLWRARKSAPGAPENLGGIVEVTSVAAAETAAGVHDAFVGTPGAIVRYALDAPVPSPEPLLDEPAFTPRRIQADGGWLHWMEDSTSEPGQLGVRRSSWNATGPSSLLCGINYPTALAVVGGAAFVVRNSATTRTLYRCDGASPTQFVAEPGHIPFRVAADAATGYVYYTTFANDQVEPPVPGAIWRKSSAGGAVELVADAAPAQVSDLVVGLEVYARVSDGTLRVGPKVPGGGLVPLVESLVQAFAADAEGVYWSGSGGIWAMRRDAP